MLRHVNSILLLSVILLLAGSTPLLAQWVVNGVGVCTDPGNQWEPSIVADGNKGAIITWADERSAYPGVYAQKIDEQGYPQWAANGEPISTGHYYHYQPQLVSDGAGGAIIVWKDERPATAGLYVQRIDANGNVLWTANGVQVTTNATQGMKLVSDGAGGAIITWDDSWPGNILAQRVDGTGSVLWTPGGVTIVTGSGYAPKITTDGGSGAIITWTDQRGANADIYVQRIDSNGNVRWTANGVFLSSLTNSDWWPRITHDQLGGAIITWWGMATYAQRVDSDGNPMWITGGVTVSTAGTDSDPQIVDAGANGAVIVYKDSGFIMAQRLDPWGNLIWNPAGVTVAVGETERHYDQVIGDGLGGVIVTWKAGSFSNTSVFAQKVDPGGTVIWTSGGVILCNAPNNQNYPTITADGFGGGIIAWMDGRGGSFDTYAQRVVRGGHWGYPAPSVAAIADVPGDQGGIVNVSWDASRLDPWPDQLISSYSVWRALNPVQATLLIETGAAVISGPKDVPALKSGRTVIRTQIIAGETYYWELVAVQEAVSFEHYAAAIPTLFDSTAVCDDYHYFQVAAHTWGGETYSSRPDSGYSVDNLSPGAPMGLAGEQVVNPDGLNITWRPNEDPDLGYYAVFKGTSENFVPGSSNLVASPPDTMYLDGDWRWDQGYFYKVAAVDIHGNLSGFALLWPENITGNNIPRPLVATHLQQNYPNPFNPSTHISFGLKETGPVSLRIYDASGRLVRVLVDQERKANTYSEIWEGRDQNGRMVASGVYFYTLSTAGFKQTRKMVLIK